MSSYTSKNKYLKNTKLSEYKLRQIIAEFCLDTSASKASLRLKINRNTVNRIYCTLRKLIFIETQKESILSGEIEVDESYFGARRVRGKRGRGAKGKIPVIGLLKRNGKVYTKIVKRCKRQDLMPVIKGKILEGSTVYTDGWKSYDGLVLNGYKHYRIYHSKDEFARGKNHINGIESFWSYTKRRLAKFNGLPKDKFLIHLKESEFRFNHKNKNLEHELLKLLKKGNILV